MHEIQLAKNIVDVLEKQVTSSEVGEVKKVFLEVGKLHYIVPDILESGFQHVPKSEKLRNAKLEIKVLPIKIQCKNCGTEREVEEMDFTCKNCTESDTQVVSGKEFIVSGIEW